MKVEILFFAQLKEAIGTGRKIVETQEGITARELARNVLSEAGLERFHRLPLLYAVNECFENGETELRDQDVLALVPPVAGG